MNDLDLAADPKASARVADLPEGYTWAVVRNPWRRLLRFLTIVAAVLTALLLLIGMPVAFSTGFGLTNQFRWLSNWQLGLLMFYWAANVAVWLAVLIIITRCIAYYRREPAPRLDDGRPDYDRIGRGSSSAEPRRWQQSVFGPE